MYVNDSDEKVQYCLAIIEQCKRIGTVCERERYKYEYIYLDEL